MTQKIQLPNASATLVLGILSICLFCCAYGIVGLALGIIALAISSGPKKLYLANPDMYDGYKNLNAGRVCAIVGVCLSALIIVIVLIEFIAVGSLLSYGSLMGKGHHF